MLQTDVSIFVNFFIENKLRMLKFSEYLGQNTNHNFQSPKPQDFPIKSTGKTQTQKLILCHTLTF